MTRLEQEWETSESLQKCGQKKRNTANLSTTHKNPSSPVFPVQPGRYRAGHEKQNRKEG